MKNIRKTITGLIILPLWRSRHILIFCEGGRGWGGKQWRKILYYRNPMDPSVQSPTFMKDSMGMDYIPVYEEQPAAAEKIFHCESKSYTAAIIGVKTEAVSVRPLMQLIRTVAKIAYDPELFTAKQNLSRRRPERRWSPIFFEIKERLDALVSASAFKFEIAGISR